MKFTCWNPDMGHEGPDDGEEIEAYSTARAAEVYVDLNFSDWSYPRECTVIVRNAEGRAYSVPVEMESVPHFHAGTAKEVVL